MIKKRNLSLSDCFYILHTLMQLVFLKGNNADETSFFCVSMHIFKALILVNKD